jgi:MOSC domain-containing protein
MTSPSPRLTRIDLHPVKSLDPILLTESRINPAGGLEHDRAWALYSVDGRWVNGKRTPAIHLIRANYAPDLSIATLSVPGDTRNIAAATFPFPSGHEAAAGWFSTYFEQKIIVRHSPGGFPDDTVANGPTIVSTASLQKICEWFPELPLEQVRRRFRASLEIDGVPAFWEDQLFGENERSVVRFRIGDVRFEGSNPCARCPVPPRYPLTGEDYIGFQKRFMERRQTELPGWSPAGRFDHFYRFTTNTRVAPTETGKLLRIGDPLTLL